MTKGVMQRSAPILIAILLLAGGATLGVLQVRWVGIASRAEEERLRRALELGAVQTAGDAEEEVRVILSLTRISAADFETQSWSQIEAGLGLWYANARFPDLLRAFSIVTDSPASAVRTYSRTQARLVASVLPADVMKVLSEAQSAGARSNGGQRSWPSVMLEANRRIIALPVPGADNQGAASAGFVIIELDTSVFYEKVLPYFVAVDLGDFLYRIVASDKTVLAESSGPFTNRQPETAVGVSSLPVLGGPFHGQVPAAPGAGSNGSISVDPLLQLWLERASGAQSARVMPPDIGFSSDAEATLQVFYPKASLDATMKLRQALNISISLGILSLLIVSMLVLWRLYRRSLSLRASEQEFVASISHELRTPISVIQATSQNLARGVVSDPARQQRYAEVIHGQIRRLSGMVESILLYAGLQSGRGRPPGLSDIDLPTFVQDLFQPLWYLAQERGSRVKLDTAGMPARICSDRVAIGLILENLVVNAIRHADPGEIRVSITATEGRILVIAVEDDGPGIPAREQSRVFEPFTRGERSVRDQKPGSGLGLHLVKRVTALLGGKVSLQSPYRSGAQGGCRFVVSLPFEEPSRGD